MVTLEEAGKRIIVALDGMELQDCQGLIRKIKDRVYAYKIHDLWDRYGPAVIGMLDSTLQARIWVDLKLHDIPNTVKLRAQAVRAAQANILTVHASGGIEMMQAARIGFGRLGPTVDGQRRVFAVTLLTSLDEQDAQTIYNQPSKAAVLSCARMAVLARVDGIVCSPQEVGILAKRSEFAGMNFVVPGIRPTAAMPDDQKRVDTPTAAIRAGATHLVIGRPITKAPDPAAAFEEIAREVASALTS